jgi:CheY-like chemotaxis protein
MTNKTTYIIDDDILSLELMKILLLKNEFCEQIITFSNPKLALDELKKNCDTPLNLPDVILLDLNMPVLDGWQFLDEFILLAIKKEIPVFIVSSSIDPYDIEKAKTYDTIKSYIMKPITAKKLELATALLETSN